MTPASMSALADLSVTMQSATAARHRLAAALREVAVAFAEGTPAVGGPARSAPLPFVDAPDPSSAGARRRPKRDYDYFAELDRRLQGLSVADTGGPVPG